jgi:hypothetical protein
MKLSWTHSLLWTMVVYIFGSSGFAQDYDYKKEIFGIAGVGNYTDGEGFLGSGLALGAGFSYRFTERWGLNFEFDRQRNAKSRNYFFTEGTTYLAGACVHYYFSDGNAQPYLELGGGWGQHDGFLGWKSYTLPDGSLSPETREDQSGNFGYLQLGTGVRFFLIESISLRPALKFYAGGVNGGFQGIFHVAYHW